MRTHGRSPTSSFLLCSLFSVALGLLREAHLDFPRTSEWQEAAVDYRERFAAYVIRPRDVLLRLPNRRIYIGPQVQEFLAGLHAEWEERLTRWTLGVRNALEADNTLPPFPTAAVATSGESDPVLEDAPVITGQEDLGDTAGGFIENRQAEGNWDATSGGQEPPPRTTASAATATPTTAMSAPSCEAEDKAAARGIRGRPRGSGRGSRVVSVGRGNGTSRKI